MPTLTIHTNLKIVKKPSTELLSQHSSTSSHMYNTPTQTQKSPSTLQEAKPCYPTTIQQVITPPKNNFPFGDIITSTKDLKTVRILHKNVNGIQKAKSWNELSNFSTQLSSLQIDICGLTETNLQWNNIRNQQARNILNKNSTLTALQTSSNREECCTSYQPGGTLTAVRNKLVGRIATTIHDNTQLGRWSGFKFNTNFGHHLNIITVYQPTKSQGIHTTYQQHVHYFRNKGIPNPDPRKLLLSDLAALISKFNENKEETILLIDANESLISNTSLLNNFLSTTNLVSLIKNPHHHPATHIRGSQCIDFIFGSKRLIDHVHASGISAFFEAPWPNTDHRGLFVDIDELGLFGATIATIPPPMRRTITSKSKKQIIKFIQSIHKTDTIDSLLTDLTELQECTSWNQSHHQRLEDIDVKFTKILLESEQKCATPIDFPWSPTLHQASTIYQYWITAYHGIRNNIDTSEQLRTLSSQLSDDSVFQNNKSRPIIKQLKLARKTLINCRLKSQELREEYLELQQELAIEQGNLTKSEAVRQLANRERQARCWRTFKILRQGRSSQGGLTHILISNKHNNNVETYQRVFDKEEIDNNLLERNIEHFSQADGTPFTTSPLIDIVGEDGCSQMALQILEGNIPQRLPKLTTLLLQKLRRVREPISLEFSLQDMCQGFSKWRERTTTSPSNKHLGIYKALIAADKYLSELSEDKSPPLPVLLTANKCLQIQHLLMSLAIQHCHTFHRWQVVHNFLIEKIPGIPRIDKLRVIHLYEADWSLIQKFFVAHKLNNLAAKQKTIPKEQAGGRPGRSAIELAACRVFMFETMRLQRLSGAVLYNDAKACYDRVIENLSNLALMKQGLPLQLAKLHSQTFQQIHYYIKHRLGIGNTPHSHRNPKPVYGVGQGSTDAPARWGFVCDPLLEIYKDLTSDAIIKSPLSTIQTNYKIAGFVDDTTTLQIKHFTAMAYIILFLQHDTQMWEKLLHTSGGKLEIQKCVFALFEWTCDNWGRPTLKNTKTNSLHIRDSHTRQIATIPQMETSSAYKYVGVYIAPDGNMSAQIKDLQAKCDDISSILSNTYFNATDANQGYTTVFTPSIKYALPVTSIPPTKLNAIQSRTTSAVLSRLGFNRHMPRQVVFASKRFGGIGLLNLPTEQGTSQIQLLLSHLRSTSYIHDSIIILIESFQLIAGMQESPLIATRSYTHIHAPWIQCIREFLRNTNATIYIPGLTQLTKHRMHDQPIMSIDLDHFSNSDLDCINACRLYLQVNFLSEISDNRGTHILHQAIKGTVDSTNSPTLWQISKSTLNWPHQPRPPQKSWNKWKRYLQYITSPTFRIRTPLGDWIQSTNTQRKWMYTRVNDRVTSVSQLPHQSFVLIPTRSRHTVSYGLSNPADQLHNDHHIPVIPLQVTATKITCNPYIQHLLVAPPRQRSCPFLEYKYKIINPICEASTLTISYLYTPSRTGLTTHAIVMMDESPHALTTFHTTIGDNDRQLTLEAYACLIPTLYCESLVHHQHTPPHIDIICATKQLQKRLIRSSAQDPSPTHTYLPDWDLTQAIYKAANKFRRPRYCHLSSDSPNQIVELLSRLMNQHSDTSTWLTAEATYSVPQLQIDSVRVASDYTQALRERHTSSPIFSYYNNKHGWDATIIDDICWTSHGKALTALPRRMHKTITQFLHKWLPLNASPSLNTIGTGRLCPFCTTCDEDHQHFLTCSHKQSVALWDEAASTVKARLISYDKQIHRHLINLIGLAITSWRGLSDPPVPDFLSPQFHDLFHRQSQIGWHHILYGRFSKAWKSHLYDNHFENCSWITFTIKTIWNNIFHIWKTRCRINHGLSDDDHRKRQMLLLEPKVVDLYGQQSELNSDDQYIFNIDIEELLTKPILTIKTWVHKATLRIKCTKNRLKAKRKQEKSKAMHIHPFFTIGRQIKPQPKANTTHKVKPCRYLSSTLTKFFPKLRRPEPPSSQNDLFPP
jgi:hypothetical protein